MKFNLSYKERIVWEHAKHIFSYVFQVLLFAFLVILLIREFNRALVDSLINVNWFMVVVIIFGALSIFFPIEKKEENKEATKKDLLLIIGLGILGAIIIFLKLRVLGWIGYLIAGLGGLIIVLLSWLLLTEKDTHSDESL